MEGLLAIVLAGVVCWLFFAPPKAKVAKGEWPIRSRRPVSDLERDFMARLQAKMPAYLVLPCPRFSEFLAVRPDIKGRRQYERRLMERRGSLLICNQFYDPCGVILIENSPKPTNDAELVETRSILAAAGLKFLRYSASDLPQSDLVVSEFKEV